MCHGLAARVLRLVLDSIAGPKEYALQFDKYGEAEHCFIRYWEDNHLKKVLCGRPNLASVAARYKNCPYEVQFGVAAAFIGYSWSQSVA